MQTAFDDTFAALRLVFSGVLPKVDVTADNGTEYALASRVASPLPQHKGAPMHFGSVRRGKAYVSFHLFPLYIYPELKSGMSASLAKRIHGKTCFNFKTPPDTATLAELRKLTESGLRVFEAKAQESARF